MSVENTGTDREAGGNAAVIVAAGRGARAGQDGPKQFSSVGGRAVLAHTLEVFAQHPRIARVALVVHADDGERVSETVGTLPAHVSVVTGGATRQASVLAGLRALAKPLHTNANPTFERVLVHDGARPFVRPGLIDAVLDAVAGKSGALPGVAVSETLKRVADGWVGETVPRADLFAAQTPQGFPFQAILDAHEEAEGLGRGDFTDDAALAEWVGLPMRLVTGDPDNTKITWPRDVAEAQRRFPPAPHFPDVRTGSGYDVHALVEGDAVTLCGVTLPHTKRLLGHSDADVALHALTDALLATCGAGDIGAHFPPSDPQWRGMASRVFVARAVALVRAAGGRIANADVTVIAEAPKVGPHREAMVAAMAAMLGIAPGRVSVKATTNERLGFLGREEGIAALASVSVVYPGGLSE